MAAIGLAERYGRTRQRKQRTLILAIVFAATIAVVFGAWAIWVGLFQPTASIEFEDVGNAAVAPDQIQVRWQLSVDPGRATTCAIQALDQNFGIVGWKIVKIPAVAVRSQVLSTVVRTAQPAISGSTYQCWLS